LLVVLISIFRLAEAAECSAIFTDGLQNNNNSGSITFNNKAQLKNSIDNILDSKNNINDNSGNSLNSCDSGACTSSGDSAESTNYNNFPDGNNITVSFQQTLALAPGNYNNLTANSEAVLELSSGDYTFKGNFSLGNLNEVIITDGGIVRIFVKGTVQINSETEININGNSANLLLYFDTNVQITSRAKISAFIYNKKDVTLNSFSEVTGSISAKNITLGSESIVNFDNTPPDFGDFCEGLILATPIVNYRFDECSYTGINGDVIDQMGNYSGQSFGNVNTNTDGQIERFTDISNADHHIETSVPVPTNFSVSTWFKKPTSTSGNPAFVLGAMQGGGDLLYIDRDDDWKWGVYNNSGSTSGDYSFNDLDNNWHHLTLVYSAGQTQLYIDGGLQETLARAPSGTLKYIGTSFDQINDVDPQGFRAPLDEFLVYDEALTAKNISVIYNNQLAKKNYDGTDRDAVDCDLIELVAGRVTLNNTADDPSFTHVCFDEPFSVVPVVFSLPTTESNVDRLTLRIRNVTVNGFDIAQVESRVNRQSPVPEGNPDQTIDFLAIVEGDYDLDGGAKMRVSSLNTKTFQGREFSGNSRGWDTISTADLGFSQSPAIIASIQTMNNEPNNSHLSGPFPYSEPFLATTIRNVNNNSFQMALERGETNSGTITNNETIGYIAITPGFDGQLTNDITYESFRSDNNVRGINTCRIVELDDYNSNPLVIASQNTRAGSDGGWLKRCSITATNVGFSIVEDGDRDMDTNHINERAGGLALGGTFKDFTNSCTGPIIDHYQIEHNGSGLTCAPETVTIKACTNDVCSPLSNVSVSLDFQTDGVTQEALSFVGSTTVSLSQTTADTLTLGVINESISSISPTVCVGGNPNLCDIVFADTGFRFFENLETNPIPTQISAKPSNTLKIQAVEKNSDTGACQAAFIDTTAIEMAATCVDPIACAGSQVAINNLITTDDITTLDKNSVLSYSSVNLDFSDDTVNSAEFIFTYPDAGKVQLHARYNIPDENGDPSGNYMLGSSNEFVVRPFGFFIDVVGNPEAKTAGGTKFIAAGEEFSTILKAVQWQADGDTDLSNNQVTKNFGNEQAPETAIISPNMVLPNLDTLPNAGVLGNLTNITFDTFSAGSNAEQGIATNDNMTYSEVGIISFTANLTDNSYLGADDVVGSEPYVGRFIPDHFILDKIDGDLAAICDSGSSLGTMPFAYSGQMSSASPSTGGAIRYGDSLNPSFTITAMSVNGDNTTLNYTGDFMKLVSDSIIRNTIVDGTNTLFAPIMDGSKDGSLGTKLTLTSDLKVVTTASLKNNEANGVVTYTYESADNFVYHHVLNAETEKFTADINLPIVSVIDSDDVTAKDADGDFDNDGDLSNALDSVLTLEPTGVEIRFGRAQLENSYGPDTSDLPQVLSINYYTDNGYLLSETDTCTTFNSKNITLNDKGLGLGKTDIREDASGKFFDEIPKGETRKIILTAPTTGPSNVNTGQVEVIYDISDWLKYDWDYDDEGIDGLFNDNPRAVATFGIYRGNDRIIYQREISR
jgi:MSHA biogenesis protein MshQ